MEKYRLELTQEEREKLLEEIKVGKRSAQRLLHARILLGSDGSSGRIPKSDKELGLALHTSKWTVHRVRERCVMEGVEAALSRKKQERRKARLIQGEEEAHLIAVCCSKPPKGRVRWTLQLLADRLVELRVVEAVSDTTVGRALKKTH